MFDSKRTRRPHHAAGPVVSAVVFVLLFPRFVLLFPRAVAVLLTMLALVLAYLLTRGRDK